MTPVTGIALVFGWGMMWFGWMYFYTKPERIR